jgi:PncC family amidohydrolase
MIRSSIEKNMNEPLEVRVGSHLILRRMKLSLAESCTGGLVSHRITNVAGSSEYFLGGIVAYSNEAKFSMLHVSPQTLETHGAVSRETVLEMARGARDTFQADIAASVSGIAGPGGGTSSKPVGTVWLCLASPDGDWAREYHFSGNREQIKSTSADAVLKLVLDYLRGEVND